MTFSLFRRAARAAAVLGAVGSALWWAAGPPAQPVLELLRSPPSNFDDLLADAAGSIGWLCLCWFGLVVALHFGALGSGAMSRASARVADQVGPRFMLSGARWLLGVTLLAGPLTSGVATAAGVGAGQPSPTAAVVLNLDRPVSQPGLDRPLAPAAPAAPAPLAAPAVPAVPTLSAAPSSVAAPTAAPTTPIRGSTPVAPMLTGTPHRDGADGSYVVRRGDTLWDVAARHLGPHATAAEIARAWPRWYATNQVAIGPNPQLIHPGLVLHAPPG